MLAGVARLQQRARTSTSKMSRTEARHKTTPRAPANVAAIEHLSTSLRALRTPSASG
jgi:hypothetical protein